MVPFAIAGVQMHVPAGDDNTVAMAHKVDVAMARFPWLQMIVFSELCGCGPIIREAARLPGPQEQMLRSAASKHGVWLVTGSLWEKADGDRIYNTASVIDPHGNVIARYRKMFPFLPYETNVSAGTEFCVFDVPQVGRFGLSICYDIWFPETTRTLTSMGAEVLLHPVMTATTDRDVELSMARATAAQFQCYVFDINGLGTGGTGRSCIVDPSGIVLYQAAGQDEIIPVEIDFEQVRRQREVGLRGLGQTLKSFRDRDVELSVYDRSSGVDAYLHTLGPLAMPSRGSLAGIGATAANSLPAAGRRRKPSH